MQNFVNDEAAQSRVKQDPHSSIASCRGTPPTFGGKVTPAEVLIANLKFLAQLYL